MKHPFFDSPREDQPSCNVRPNTLLSRRSFLRSAGLGLSAGVIAPVLTGCPRGRPAELSPTTSTPLFTDITQSAGLDFIQADGGCGKRYFVQQVAAGAAFIDVMGTGHLDIYFPQPKPLGTCRYPSPLRHRLYRNDGQGNYHLAPDAFGGVDTDYGISAAVGDYDNDGHADLYVCCYGRNTLFRNRGDGTFEDVTEKAGVGLKGFSTGAVWFDYDGDGFLDLFVSQYCEWSVETDQRCAGPGGEPDACAPTTYQPASDVLYHNNGDGSFTEVTAKAGIGKEKRRSLGVAAADFFGSGRLDLFVANDIGPNFLYRNQGDGTFEDVAMQTNAAFGLNGQSQANMGVAVGDYDGDGDLDVLVTTFSNEPDTLYRNEGAYFTDVSVESGIAGPTRPMLAFGAGFLDSRNLGRLDIFCANGHVSPFIHEQNSGMTYKERNQLLLNDGASKFTEARDALPNGVRVHRGACFGDINNDGRIDILVTANDDRPTLLRNDSPPANYLMLQLTTARGCVTPIGTRCIATIKGRKLLRVVLGGGSYGGDSDHRVHFGLAKDSKVDRLEIHWMSGKVQTLTDVKANQILTIREA